MKISYFFQLPIRFLHNSYWCLKIYKVVLQINLYLVIIICNDVDLIASRLADVNKETC
jgi:hypothetical protein